MSIEQRTPFDDGLAKGGAMAERIHAFDWSTTPLGPMDAWPESLKATVRILLDSRYPLFVWWGRDQVNIYNDAYAPFLGPRHPDALGRAAPTVWRDVWPVVGPSEKSHRSSPSPRSCRATQRPRRRAEGPHR